MKQCLSCFNQYDENYSVCPKCGQNENVEPEEPIHLTPGTVLCNRYVIGTAVGAGGFGIVYKAWDQKLESIVAVKEFFVNRLVTRAPGTRDLIVTQKGKSEFEYRKQRFLAEARTMAKFGSHRSIPNVFEFFEENNTAYIVMELLQGISLSEYIANNGGKIDIEFATMIVNEVGNALNSLHKEGITHCDVAPDNIFLCNGKEIKVKLMDLGAAKLKDSSTDVIDIILKPGYSPAEQYDNSKNIGPWTDIYSLGATFYMMITGIKPDESTNRKIEDTTVPPAQMDESVNENLSNTIMKAMAIDIHMRFKKVDEFLLAINGEKKVVTLSKEKKRRKTKRFVSIALALVILITTIGIVARNYEKEAAEGYLKPATISIWYSVNEGSSEHEAMQFIVDDFKSVFPDVTVELRAIPSEAYTEELSNAAKNGELPDLFESTDLNDTILEDARSIEKLLNTEQAKACLFLNQYSAHYNGTKRLPLAIEVPVAYVITAGNTSTEYSKKYFGNVTDFNVSGNSIAYDSRCKALVENNFGSSNFADIATFMDNASNTSPVLLSSTMILSEFRNTLVGYEKECVFYDAEKIYCDYTYEWSIGSEGGNELVAAERFLSWMLGNSYQSALMITKCNEGQIPVNKTCFNTKIESKYLAPISEIYERFVFDTK